jgi:hypothetical protein
MDLVTTGLLEAQSAETTRREEAARPDGKGSVESLVDRIEAITGWSLTGSQRAAAMQGIHFGLGICPGAHRSRAGLGGRRRTARRGLVYGVLLWAVNDEYLNTKLGLAAPFAAYPLETHWRGFVGHVVLGMATDAGVDILGG